MQTQHGGPDTGRHRGHGKEGVQAWSGPSEGHSRVTRRTSLVRGAGCGAEGGSSRPLKPMSWRPTLCPAPGPSTSARSGANLPWGQLLQPHRPHARRCRPLGSVMPGAWEGAGLRAAAGAQRLLTGSHPIVSRFNAFTQLLTATLTANATNAADGQVKLWVFTCGSFLCRLSPHNSKVKIKQDHLLLFELPKTPEIIGD